MRVLLFTLALLAPFTCAPAAESAAAPPPPLKTPGDQSAYRHLVLDNGLRVVLCSDPKLNLSSAALSVDAGSFDEPAERPGLAHYLEHLLFLGTDKYPTPGSYQNFITTNGGEVAGFTHADHTSYAFQIRHDAFPGALDRFAQFFVAPRFDTDFADREVTAIQNEYERHGDNDTARLQFVSNELYDPASPDAHFRLGNRATLAGTPREAVIDFFHSRYSADQMALALCGPADLDRLEYFARAHFAALPRRPVAPRPAATAYLPPRAALRTVDIVSAGQTPLLYLQFPVGPTRAHYAAKPVQLLNALLTTGGEGSLLACLQAEGLALGISAELDDRAADHGAYYLIIPLTTQGQAQTQRVLQLVFTYVRLLQHSPFPAAFFAERAELACRDEMFGDRGDGHPRAIALAEAALFHPDAPAQRVPFLWTSPDDNAYRAVLDVLRPDNLLVAFLAPDRPADRTEKYYGFSYRYTEETGASFTSLAAVAPEDVGFRLPAPNPFIAADTTLLPTQPTRIVDEPTLQLFYTQESDLARPQVAYVFRLRPGNAPHTPAAAAQLLYYELAIRRALQPFEADAAAAGIQFECSADAAGLHLAVSGYSGSAERFLTRLIDFVAAPALDPAAFTAIRDLIVNSLESFDRAEAFQVGRSRLLTLYCDTAHLPAEMLPAARAMTAEQLLVAPRTFFACGRIDGMVCGNVVPSEAARLAGLLRDRLQLAAAPAEAIMRARHLRQPAGETIVDAAVVPGENSFVAFSFAYAADTPEQRAAAELIGTFASDDFYTDLRTHQQLGYVVAGGSTTDSAPLRTFGVVQSSEYSSDELRRRIEAYFTDLGRRWAALSPAQFQDLRSGVRARLEQQPTSAAARADQLFEYAADYAEDWGRTTSTLAALDQLTQARVGQIIAELTTPATRRLVIVQLTAKGHVLKTPPPPSFTDREAWKRTRTYK